MPSSDGALGADVGCTVIAFPPRRGLVPRAAENRLGEAGSFLAALLVVPLVVGAASLVALALLVLFWAAVPVALAAIAWVLTRRSRRPRALVAVGGARPA